MLSFIYSLIALVICVKSVKTELRYKTSLHEQSPLSRLEPATVE